MRTTFDCIRGCAFPEGLALADSALRISGMSNDGLAGCLEGIRYANKDKWRAVETIMWANPLAANGGESVARAVMIQNGYMLPALQVRVDDILELDKAYFVDFYWDIPNGPVAGELDGKDKYRVPEMTDGRDVVEVLSDERLRESRITSKVKVMRFCYADVMDQERFRKLLDGFGVPKGFAVPRVAL